MFGCNGPENDRKPPKRLEIMTWEDLSARTFFSHLAKMLSPNLSQRYGENTPISLFFLNRGDLTDDPGHYRNEQ